MRITKNSKFIIMMMIMTAMIALTGCRVRITNNSDVSNVRYDESGFLTETYQMRRDELGLSTAEKPLLPSFGGSSDEDDSDEYGDYESIDYNPEEEEEYVEPPETSTDTNTNTSSNTNTNSGTGTGNSTVTRRSVSPSRRTTGGTTTATTYTVKFDPGEGAITGSKKGEVASHTTRKGYSVSAPTVQARDGYEFKGWKSGDKTVSAGATIKVTANKTYKAVWEKKETTTKTYTISFDADGGTPAPSSASVKEGDSYKITENPTKSGYDFKGWQGDSTYMVGDEIKSIKKDISLKAVWARKEAEGYWQDMFNDAYDASKKVGCYVDGEEKETWIQDCNIKKVAADENPKYVIAIVKWPKDGEEFDDETKELIASLREKYPDAKVLAASSEATKDKNTKLAYQIELMKRIHGSSIDKENKSAEELIGKDAVVNIKD